MMQDPFGLNTVAPLSLQFVQPDRSKMICLDAVEDVPEPDYCVHGRTRCYHCERWCHLGVETHQIVAAGEATPFCLTCAKMIHEKYGPVEMTGPVYRADDKGKGHKGRRP